MTGRSTLKSPTTIREGTIMARDPIHPGRFLADELEALGMSVPEVAEVLHVPANRIYQLLKGQRALTADTALRLSQWLGTSAEMWLNLQKLYELRLAEQQAGEKIRKTIVRREAARAA
jgi:addiction module HigA family antidote